MPRKSFDFDIRPAGLKDAGIIEKIMSVSSASLDDPSLFIKDDLGFIEELLTHHGFGLISFHARKNPAAYLLVSFPGLSAENLGRDLHFSNPQLIRVAHIESLAVLPEYRGHHLQQALLSFVEKQLNNEYPYRLATVSPLNLPSLKSFQACGYKIVSTKEKYRGYLRHILLKEKPAFSLNNQN